MGLFDGIGSSIHWGWSPAMERSEMVRLAPTQSAQQHFQACLDQLAAPAAEARRQRLEARRAERRLARRIARNVKRDR